ncbi:MAG: transglutaminase domain-containing protein [Treponema sp.]|nr:transglutaminase domain-containing protein [Treponema sp.]
MNKIASIILFSLRLFFYLSAAMLLLLHPGIVISFDRVGLVQWFLVIPFAALIAFLPGRNAEPPGLAKGLPVPVMGRLRTKIIAALLLTVIFSVWAAGLSAAVLPLLLAGAAAFVLTLLLFHYPRWGKLSALEPFFLAWVCFRLLVFSRAGEDVAGESSGLTQFILVWTAVVFLFHSVVVYLCLHPGSSGGVKTEGAVFGLSAAAALVLALAVLPADFIRNTVIDNLLPDQIERMSSQSDDDWGIPDDGERDGRRTLPGDEGGRSPSLRSLSEHNWPGQGRRGRGGEGGEQSQQFTVMVVASRHEPVYMANAIRARLDPVDGFVPFPDDLISRLSAQRFFAAWFDSDPAFDMGRERHEVFSLSTLPQKFLPYRPVVIDPTILSENTGPFRYIHRNVSNVHPRDPLELLGVPIRPLNSFDRIRLSRYLESPLEDADRQIFAEHLDHVLQSWEGLRERFMGETRNDHMETILAILMSFSEYQYNVNPDNYSSISDMIHFLRYSREGDCVEFSNAAALLGRLAGIPSRVVTGFLAANSLQTPAHLRGLAALRSRIPVLQEFPFDELILVTTAHGHSWTQFYVPDYGWLDFEATGFAIPPMGIGDGNLRDVVIPLWEENQLFAPVRAFPWSAVLRASAFLAALALAAAYVLRYGREAVLASAARRGGRRGARALYLLLLAQLAADGKPIKPVSKTAPEYARLFGAAGEGGSFAGFAQRYTELRWRDFSDRAEMEVRFARLKDEYRKILAENRRKGVLAVFIRAISLRGLAYL